MEVILCIVIIIFLGFIIEYNICTSLKNKVKQAESSIDVFLNQRFDLIPNLVETVKGYAKYEQETLAKIMSLRNSYMNNKNFQSAYTLNSEFINLLDTAEEVPELKASKHFLELQKSLVKIESQLQAARRVYNGNVTLYNTKITTFPGNLIAEMMNFKEFEFFEIEEYKKENPMKK